MVGVLYRPESGPFAQARNHSSQEGGLSQSIARALNEQLGNMDIEKMLRAFDRGLVGRMKRKAQEYQATDIRQRLQGLRLRGHATAKRFASCEQGECRRQLGRFPDSRPHGSVRRGRPVRPPRACFHVGKLEPEGAYTCFSKQIGHVSHEGM